MGIWRRSRWSAVMVATLAWVFVVAGLPGTSAAGDDGGPPPQDEQDGDGPEPGDHPATAEDPGEDTAAEEEGGVSASQDSDDVGPEPEAVGTEPTEPEPEPSGAEGAEGDGGEGVEEDGPPGEDGLPEGFVLGVDDVPGPDDEILGHTPFSRWWRKADGLVGFESFTAPVFFEDDDGIWQAIDLSLELSLDDGAFVGRTVPSGSARISPISLASLPTIQAGPLDQSLKVRYPDVVGAVEGFVDESGAVRFPGALGENADLRVRLALEGFKDELVLTAPSTARAGYRVRFDLPLGVSAMDADGGGVTFVDAQGIEIGSYGQGAMAWDAADPDAAETAVTVSVVASGLSWVTVAVEVDPVWLEDPARVFPVTVDPLGIWSVDPGASPQCTTSPSTYNGCDTYVNSDNPTGAYWTQTQLRVGSPGLELEPGTSLYSRARTYLLFPTDCHGCYQPKTVKTAYVRMWAYYTKGGTTGRPFDLYGLTQFPTSSTTWGNQPARDSSYSATRTEHGADKYYYWWPTTLVHAWWQGTRPNRGMVIYARSEHDPDYGRRFYSSEAVGTVGSAKIPRLYVEYYNYPGQPSSVTPKAGDAELNATWPAVDNGGGTLTYNVRLYRSNGTLVASTTKCANCTLSHTFTGLSNGTAYYVRVSGSNETGEGAYRQSATAVPDGTPPTTPSVSSSTHSSQTAWSTNDAPCFSWSASDPETGVNGYSWTLNQTSSTTPNTSSNGTGTSTCYSGVADGEWWFHVRARNGRVGANMWGAAAHYRVRIDKTPPPAPTVTSSTHPDQTGWYPSGDVTLSWTASDTSGINGYSWVLDQSSSTTPNTTSQGTATTTSYSGLADGVWWFHVRARNGSNLWGATRHFKIQIDRNAPTPPTVSSSTHPSQTTWYNNSSPSFSWSATAPSGVDGYSWTLDQNSTTTPNTTSQGSATSTSYSGLADGTWWFHVRARSTTGIWGGTTHFKVNIDTTPPPAPTVTSTTHPSTTTWYPNNQPKLSWTATDVSGITGYSYVLNQSSSTTPDTTSEGTATTKTYTGLADGIWWFHVRARDGAGLWGATTHFRIRIDTTPPPKPTLTSSSHPNSERWSTLRDVTASWTATDATSGVAGVDFQLDRFPGTQTVGPTRSTSASGSRTYSGVGYGSWWFHVAAVDRAGNWSQPAHYRVQIRPACSGNGALTIGQPAAVVHGRDRFAIVGTVPSDFVRVDAYRDSNGNGVWDSGDSLIAQAGVPRQATMFDIEVPLVAGPNCVFLRAVDLRDGSSQTWGPTAAPVMFGLPNAGFAGSPGTQSPDSGGDDSYVPDEPPGPGPEPGLLEVQLADPALMPQGLLPGVLDATRVFPESDDLNLSLWWQARVEVGSEDALAALWLALPSVLHVQAVTPVALQQTRSFAVPPNDTEYPNQTVLNLINIEGAWTQFRGGLGTGTSTVVSNDRIAIVDSSMYIGGDGTQQFHADFQSDFNGEFDCLSTSGACRVVAYADRRGNSSLHGTAVAGMAAGATNNSEGIASAGYHTNFISYRVINNEGRCGQEPDPGTFARVCRALEAIRLAASHRSNLRIGPINASLGGPRNTLSHGTDVTAEMATNYAGRRGAVLIAAAGNVGGDRRAYNNCLANNAGLVNRESFCAAETRYHPPGWPAYPAAAHGAIAVGATDSTSAATARSRVATWNNHESNTGEFVDIAAPCSTTLQATFDLREQPPAHDYRERECGTSLATPLVSGVVALLTRDMPPIRAALRVLSAAAPFSEAALHGQLGRGVLDAQAAATNLAVRLGGRDRGETSAQVSREVFPGHHSLDRNHEWVPGAVVLVRGDDGRNGQDGFADSLAAAGLAARLDAPILLVQRRDLARWSGWDSPVRNEIDRLLGCPNPATGLHQLTPNDPNRNRNDIVWIIGGPDALPDGSDGTVGVEGALSNCFRPAQRYRVAGPTRYDTSALIAREIVRLTPGGDTFDVAIASGTRFADAVVISAYAAHHGIPLLLVPGAEQAEQTLPLEVRRFLFDHRSRINRIRLAGGPAAVSDNMASQVQQAASRPLDRYGGTDRYHTARLVAEGLFPQANTATIATGNRWPDAVAGSILTARSSVRGVPILLTPSQGDLNRHAATSLYILNVRSAFLLGLTAAISRQVQDQVEGCVRRLADSYCWKVINEPFP